MTTPQDNYIEKVIESFRNIDSVIWDYEGESKVIEDFIRQSLEEQQEIILSCLPELKSRDPYDEDFDYTRWNDCIDQFLSNLKSKGLIK